MKPSIHSLPPSGAGLTCGMAKRLFIALELPESCRNTLAGLNPHVKGLRWLPAEQLHVTMSFIGHLNSIREERLREALGKVRLPAFFLPIQGVGTFGGAQPSVVWAGLGTGHPHLFALHKHVQDAVLHAGLEPDLKPFHPHITLGRANGVSECDSIAVLAAERGDRVRLVEGDGFCDVLERPVARRSDIHRRDAARVLDGERAHTGEDDPELGVTGTGVRQSTPRAPLSHRKGAGSIPIVPGESRSCNAATASKASERAERITGIYSRSQRFPGDRDLQCLP